jgi:hypothetical protein
MNREERPIVFTITQTDDGYIIKKDGLQIRSSVTDLFYKMVRITEQYNEDNHAVLFEVD